ncbi:MAG: response regulator transcription factor [Microbacterium sp.]
MVRVLIVEDDPNLRTTLSDALAREGYRVDAVPDGAQALTLTAQNDIDVILLDRDLPLFSGDAVCKALVAAKYPARILMLTAAGTLSDRVRGLDLGADDYLSKPFAYVELSARLRALTRRDRDQDHDPLLTAGDLILDTTRRTAERAGRPLRLTPKELDVLELLIRADGGFLTVDQLLDAVWEDPHDRTRGVVKVLVYSLRKKLGFPGIVGHEPGHGYRIDVRT